MSLDININHFLPNFSTELEELKKGMETIMAAIDDLKLLVTNLGTDITEIGEDIDEILATLASHVGGLTAAEVAELTTSLTDLKSRTRAAADKVPEPPPVTPPVTP